MHCAFILTMVEVRDEAAFDRYRAAVAAVNARLGGEIVMRGRAVEMLQGEGAGGEVVVALGFPSAEAARSYIASADYRSLDQLREAAGDFRIRLVCV